MRVESFDGAHVLSSGAFLNFLIVFISRIEAGTIGDRSSSHLNNDFSEITTLHSNNQKFIVYRDAIEGECYLQRTIQINLAEQPYSRTFFIGNQKITSNNSVYEELGQDVLSYCKNYSMFMMEERNSNVKSRRRKRQVPQSKKEYFKGQTQTQFISFDNEGKSDKGGTAEATAEQDKSRATVQGRLGMGQAQSQSGSGDPCEELVGSFRSAGQFGSSYPTGQGSNVPSSIAGSPQQGVSLPRQFDSSLYPSLQSPSGAGTSYPPGQGSNIPPNTSGSPQQGANVPSQFGGSSYPPLQPATGTGASYPPGQGFNTPSNVAGSPQQGTNVPGQFGGSLYPSLPPTGTGTFYPSGHESKTPPNVSGSPQQGANVPGQFGSSLNPTGIYGSGQKQLGYPSGGQPDTSSIPQIFTPTGGVGNGQSQTGSASFPFSRDGQPGASAGSLVTQGTGSIYPQPSGYPSIQTGSNALQPGYGQGQGGLIAGSGQPIYTSPGTGSSLQQTGGQVSYPKQSGYNPQTGLVSGIQSGIGSGGSTYTPQQGFTPSGGTDVGRFQGGGTLYPLGYVPQLGTGSSAYAPGSGAPHGSVLYTLPYQGYIPQSNSGYPPQFGSGLPQAGSNYGQQPGSNQFQGGGGAYPQQPLYPPQSAGFPSTLPHTSNQVQGPQSGTSNVGYPQYLGYPVPGGISNYPQSSGQSFQGGMDSQRGGQSGATSVTPDGKYPLTGATSLPTDGIYPRPGVPVAGIYPQIGGSSVPAFGVYPQGAGTLLPGGGGGYPQQGATSTPVGGSYPQGGGTSIPGVVNYPQGGSTSIPGGGYAQGGGTLSTGGGGGYPQGGGTSIPGGVNYPQGGGYAQGGGTLLPGGGGGYPQGGATLAPGGVYPQGGSTLIPGGGGGYVGAPSIAGVGGYPQGATAITGGFISPQATPTSQTNVNYPQGSTSYYPYIPGTGNGGQQLPSGFPTSSTNTSLIQGGGQNVDSSSSSQINAIDTASGESQSLSSLNLNPNGTNAAASAQGKTRNGMAQAQVSGTYTGSFSAQAQTSDNEKSVQTQIFGNTTSASSSSQGKAGKSESQSQIQYNYNTGATLAESQGSGINYNTNSQIQVGNRGGIADAQSTGTGSTSSQAQIGFLPLDPKRKDQTALFEGGGTSSSQNSASSGQSQTQLQGSFKSGTSFIGSAQSSVGKTQNKTKLSFDSSDLSFPINDASKPISTTEQATKQVVKKENNIFKSTVPLSAVPQNDQKDFTINAAVDNEPAQYQDAAIKSQKYDAYIDRDSFEMRKPFLNAGDLVPGTSNYRIPVGFKGKVTSKAGDVTHATASSLGHAQTQTVLLKPGKGRVIVNNRNQSEQQKFQNDSDLINDRKNAFDEYVTVTKSETGGLNGAKKFAHTYYTKSSTCGYFTFTCNYVDGSNGRTKICKPGSPTYSDGTPCR